MQTKITSIGKRIPLKLTMANHEVSGRHRLSDEGRHLVNATKPHYQTAEIDRLAK
jgi:hypothetical protein